jgi:hypothetical protein
MTSLPIPSVRPATLKLPRSHDSAKAVYWRPNNLFLDDLSVCAENPALQGGDVEHGQRSCPCIGLAFKSLRGYNVGMKKTNLYLTEPSIAKLQELAKQTGLSVAELIRRAIDDFLNKKK